MKKQAASILIFLFLAALFTGCSRGDVSRVQKTIGDSELFAPREIRSAMEVVIRQFRRTFCGCTLTELCYDEEYSAAASEEWAAQYDADEAIVLISSFDVDASGGDGSLNPNSTYDDFIWVLTRSRGGGWTLQTWGY